MAGSQASCPSTLPPNRPPTTRRVWTKPEEQALIHALKELVVNGWRADNAFKPGYLNQLETAIAAKFPNSRLTAQRHINSKLAVWKKTYGQVSGICNTSGFGIDSELNMVTVELDDVWDNYVKVHPDVAGFRNKCFPYYDDWVIIFGRDRTTGAVAQQIENAILDLEHPHEVYEVVYDKHVKHGAKGSTSNGKTGRGDGVGGGVQVVNLDSDDESDVQSMRGENGTCKGKGKVSADAKKRKRGDSLQLLQEFVPVVKQFFTEASNSFEGMATRIAPVGVHERPPSPPNKTRQVIDLVGKIVGMPADLRVRISHKIVSSPQNTELFLNMDEECQTSFVRLLMQGLLD